MPTYTSAQLQARVAIEIRDNGQTFASSEVTECVQRSIDDDVVFTPIEIQVPLTGVRSYPLDSSYMNIYEVKLDANSDGFPESDFPGTAYDYTNNILNIDPHYMNAQGTLFIIVGKKWVFTDSIPSYLASYIINSSIYYLTELLENTYESRFLNNDATMSDMLNRGTQAKQERDRLRKQLRNQRAVRQ